MPSLYIQICKGCYTTRLAKLPALESFLRGHMYTAVKPDLSVTCILSILLRLFFVAKELTLEGICLSHQIHYDRYGKDGVFSHKEVSVLFVPGLSDCLPSLNAWKEQWLAHKKAIADRERHTALKKEVCISIVSF